MEDAGMASNSQIDLQQIGQTKSGITNNSVDVSKDFPESLGALWNYLSSWLTSGGGVNGPVVHRCNLKRMYSIHDTPWTQGPIIEGLVHLYRNSG